MKAKFTYKEFTLLAGIVVALIIMLTLWLNPASSESGGISRKFIPSVTKPAAKAVVEKAALAVRNIVE